MAKHKTVTVKTTIEAALRDGASEIASLTEEMGSWRDGMEEKLSSTSKYDQVSDAADTLEGADIESLVDALCDALSEAQTGRKATAGCPEHVIGTPCPVCKWAGVAAPKIPSRRFEVTAVSPLFEDRDVLSESFATTEIQAYKGKSLSRATRCEEACGLIRQACDLVASALDDVESALDTAEEGTKDGAAPLTDEEREAAETEREEQRDRVSTLRDAVTEITDALDEIEGVEFPGMYG
jgi:hypothetical protein